MTALGNEIVSLPLDKSLNINGADVYSLWGNPKASDIVCH
jgi:hypothetical protein